MKIVLMVGLIFVPIKIKLFKLDNVDFLILLRFASWLISVIIVWIFYFKSIFNMKLPKLLAYNLSIFILNQFILIVI